MKGAPMHPLARVIWRAARDAQDAGIDLEAAQHISGADTKSAAVQARLASLCARRYLTRIGHKHWPRWVAGLNVPEGESPEIGSPPVQSRSAWAKPFDDLSSSQFTARLQGTPTSIWHLASLVAAQS